MIEMVQDWWTMMIYLQIHYCRKYHSMQGLEQHVEHLGNSFAWEASFSTETLRSLSGSELTNKAEKLKLKGETTTIITITIKNSLLWFESLQNVHPVTGSSPLAYRHLCGDTIWCFLMRGLWVLVSVFSSHFLYPQEAPPPHPTPPPKTHTHTP